MSREVSGTRIASLVLARRNVRTVLIVANQSGAMCAGYPMLDALGREVFLPCGPRFRFFCYRTCEAVAHADEAARRLHPFALHGTAYGRGREAKLVCSLDHGQRFQMGHSIEECLMLRRDDDADDLLHGALAERDHVHESLGIGFLFGEVAL